MPNHLAFSSSQLLVPASEAEVTAKWLQNALSNTFSDLAFETVEAERIGEEYGLASQIFRYRWEAGRTARSVVVKLWRTDGPAGMNEALFYRTFGNAIGTRIPTCFHAAVDPEQKRGVLILEDLGAAVQGDCLQQLTFEQAKAVAWSLAGVHATWVQHQMLHRAQWLPFISRWERDASWFPPRRALFLKRFGERVDDLARSLLAQIERVPAITNERLSGAAITLLHTDLHLDNLVFEEGTKPVILDWARCAKGPIALDLADFLFEMCKPRDVEQVLAIYLGAFEERCGEALDATEVQRQLGGALSRRFAAATCGVARWQPASPREAAIIDASIQRAVHAVGYWSAQDPNLLAFLE